MNAYVLVEIAKRNQGIISDREFALKNGFTKQNIVDWKSGKSLPVWDNMEKLALAANMELWEAVKVMKEAEARMKQAGFITLPVIQGVAIATSTGLSLFTVTHMTSLPLFGAVVETLRLYIM
jgi:hypothetical protein